MGLFLWHVPFEALELHAHHDLLGAGFNLHLHGMLIAFFITKMATELEQFRQLKFQESKLAALGTLAAGATNCHIDLELCSAICQLIHRDIFMHSPLFLILAFVVILEPSSAFSCDPCSIFNSIESVRPAPDTFRFGMAEQFTSFGKIQDGGRHVDNAAHQHMQSSITQLHASYDLNSSVSFQVTLPYISRRFQRLEGGQSQRGTQAGIGDMSALVRYVPYEYRQEESTYNLQLFAGLKLPTGDSEQLGEGPEEAEGEQHTRITQHGGSEHEDEAHAEEPMVRNSIHGHDLALGSGSYDFPTGFVLFAQRGSSFLTGSLQYTFRTRGDFDYEYADELLWELSPGYFVHISHDDTLALKANLSAEHKGKDNIDGEHDGDTGTNALFLGPELVLTTDDWRWALGWDIPLDINNSGIQSVSDYKLRAAVQHRF